MFVGHIVLSLIIALFSFGFLYNMSYSIVTKIQLYGFYGEQIEVNDNILSVIDGVSFIGAIIVFLGIVLFLIGQRFAYILEINTAIQKLEGGDLSYRIDVTGEDEISDLANSLNHLAQTLESYMQKEEELKKERIELIQSLSHDIRTPLTAIISYSDFIQHKRYDSTEKLEDYIGIIQSKAFQIKELIELLFDTDRSTGVLVTEEVFDGHLLVEQLIQEYEDILEDEGFKVEVMLESLGEFKTRLHPQDMVRIFDNLSSNIIKYAESTKSIELVVRRKNDILELIEKNTIRIDPNKTIESHGIGLRNIKQLAKKYRGTVSIVEEEGIYEIAIALHL